ncbi:MULTISPECIES: hydroxyacid dehydrogenase [Glycomyces]|uniref:Hydroxyacid dehydrogenase n=2 Tax=Glycomyces TaxID=58113 RepID=A0A9X3SWC5_9ACTN|nr:hydroxyacid dehydrogenase [Glycomyces lechevalierae]MDA1383881.1 hydroxyacid dehydrogenase [Glycomyces lechevalierae]MDR7341127.1 phosphoglycerate dehydrogenase-like enzyme [Glycomyces lechevalierae]
MADHPKALFAMDPVFLPQLFPEPLMRRLGAALDIDPGTVAERLDGPGTDEILADVEVIVSGWGAPPLDAAVLERAPKLRAVLHAAGSVKGLVGDALWERGIAVASAAGANALPVAEYTLAAILMAGKGIFGLRERFRAERSFELGYIHPEVGNFGLRVGLIGASAIGRRVIELLRPFDVEVLLADPFVSEDEAAALGVRLVDLDHLVAQAAVVSVHAPDLPETRHLIDAERLAAMKDGTVLINTARGRLVDTDALVAELRTGRLAAVLDVTHPEPPQADSPLFDLPNVFMTPHVAGSQGNELARMGLCTVEEAERFAAGQPLLNRVDPELLGRRA